MATGKMQPGKLQHCHTRPAPSPARIALLPVAPRAKQQKGAPALSARAPRVLLCAPLLPASPRIAKPIAPGRLAAEARADRLQPSRLKIQPPSAALREACTKPAKVPGALQAAKQGGAAKPAKVALPKLTALPGGAPVRRRVDAPAPRIARPVIVGAPHISDAPRTARPVSAQPAATEAASSKGDDDPGPQPDAAGGTAGGGRTNRAPTAAHQAPDAAAARSLCSAVAGRGATAHLQELAAPPRAVLAPSVCPLHPWEQP
ncbi:MAG: hypothetical protein ABIO70_24515 [Pseudomonadota bacterium]